MDWAIHQTEVRFDIRAERAEYEYLFNHPARVLQDRLARLGAATRLKKFLYQSGKEPTEKRHKQADCFIRQEYLAGEKRKAITSRKKALTESA
jgi:hypothetical protein